MEITALLPIHHLLLTVNSVLWCKKSKGKVHPRRGHEGPEGEYRHRSTFPLTLVLDGGGWSMQRPGHFTPEKETHYPLYRRLDGPQGQSGWVQKISPPARIRSPDHPAHSESLYLLCYPGPCIMVYALQYLSQMPV